MANSPAPSAATHVAFGELTLLAERDRIVEVLTGLRDEPDFRFQQLIDLCGADYPDRARSGSTWSTTCCR